jgi:hypothetical protein
MCRNGFRGALLQRLVGEQPRRRIGELGRRPAPKQHRLDQHGRPIAETLTRRRDVGNPGGVGQREARDLAQRARRFVAIQIRDVVDRERYDGLVPVTITL